MAKKSKGKYLKEQTKSTASKTSKLLVKICVVAVVVLAFAVCGVLFISNSRSVFDTIVRAGYQGTQEQWLASLVGEESGIADTQTAYELACSNGYRKSEVEWIKTLTGVTAESGSPFKIACQNGFEGSLVDWLNQIADEPDNLGKSHEGEEKTEYELACYFGYTGSFIEWLVSVTQDRVY